MREGEKVRSGRVRSKSLSPARKICAPLGSGTRLDLQQRNALGTRIITRGAGVGGWLLGRILSEI